MGTGSGKGGAGEPLAADRPVQGSEPKGGVKPDDEARIDVAGPGEPLAADRPTQGAEPNGGEAAGEARIDMAGPGGPDMASFI